MYPFSMGQILKNLQLPLSDNSHKDKMNADELAA